MISRLLPTHIGYFLADCGGEALFLLSARHRNIVGNNIKHVLSAELDSRKLQVIERGVLKNMVKNYFDLTKLSQLRLEELERSVTIEGWHHLTESVNGPTGTIIATAHLGNFEVAAQVLAARGIKMAIFVEAFDSAAFLRNIAELRLRNGCRILPVSTGGMRDGLQILRHGGTVIIVCDRDIQGNGTEIKFFGEKTSLPFGAASLAIRTGATIVPVFSVRKPGNRFTIYIEASLRLAELGNRSHSIRANSERLVAVVERYVRQYPEQWVVLEPIWRNQIGQFNSVHHTN
jgi:phosphatidylinositol dimannoside acyltransferase